MPFTAFRRSSSISPIARAAISWGFELVLCNFLYESLVLSLLFCSCFSLWAFVSLLFYCFTYWWRPCPPVINCQFCWIWFGRSSASLMWPFWCFFVCKYFLRVPKCLLQEFFFLPLLAALIGRSYSGWIIYLTHFNDFFGHWLLNRLRIISVVWVILPYFVLLRCSFFFPPNWIGKKEKKKCNLHLIHNL